MTQGPDYAPSDEDRKLFADMRAEVLKRELAGSDNFDKSVLTLSSAGLGLSLTFLKDFGVTSVSSPWALYASWSAFVLATLCTMVSFLVSMKAQHCQLLLAERAYMKGDASAFDAPNRWNTVTVWLNRVSAPCFIAALVMTTYFVISNIEERRTMSPIQPIFPKVSADGLEKKGAPVPPMQRPTPAPTPAPSPKPNIEG